ncbi:MAG: hypothetical protein ACUVSL_02145 [Chloroflexus sp.]|uniref:hypothetical protein n=1 Tax=Chloroflexus sp. TaxID=1904827 RepID=UPI0040499D19
MPGHHLWQKRWLPSVFFEQVFDGSESADQVLAYLRGQRLATATEADFPQHPIERIRWKSPYPLIRHHFGLPTMQATIDGIARIAEARCLDVISLGIDQDAQENFFRPDRQDPAHAWERVAYRCAVQMTIVRSTLLAGGEIIPC